MGGGDIFHFSLYVAGDGPNSKRAVANLRAFCRDRLGDRFKIEIIDVLARPEKALENKVFLTPMLSIQTPLPVKEIFGDLADPSVLLEALDLSDKSDGT